MTAHERPRFSVIAGPNGSGKTTLASLLIEQGFPLGPFINPDVIAAAIEGESAQRLIGAARETLRATKECIALRRSFSRETTLSGDEILRSMAAARRSGFDVMLIFVCLRDVFAAQDRVRGRVVLGGHDIPPEVQVRRFPRSLANAARATAIAHRAFFFHNGGVGHVLVGEAEDGQVLWTDARTAPWIATATAGLPRPPP